MKKISSLLSAVLITVTIASCGYTPRIKTDNGIASLEKIKLGGVEQWVLIRGRDKSNPVLLFVHGGPGSPEMPLAHYFSDKLEDHFVVVNWDQRGAGKSYSHVPKETLTFERILADTYELIEILRARFNADKIYLVGHSWGSMLGSITAKRHPEALYAYIGIGQVVDMKRNEEISYRFVTDEARKQKNKKAVRELEKIGPPPYDNIWELVTQRSWLTKFGGAVHNTDNLHKYVKIAFRTSREYTPFDFVKWELGGYRSVKAMWSEMVKFNLFEQAPRIEVPVYFFAGRYDYNTPFELVEEYFRALDAPMGKRIVWFEESAHSPNIEEPEKFAEAMLKVKKETYSK